MTQHMTRRQFLKHAAMAGGLILGGAALNGCAPAPPPVTEIKRETVVVTRVVEATRLVERVVEITRVAPTPTRTPIPTPEPPAEGIIWYVDIEHEKILKDPQLAPAHMQTRAYRADVQSIASWLICDPIHYTEVSKELAAEQNVRAIAISGNVTDWDQYDFAKFQPLFEIVKEGRIPVIGFCGGHQLIGLMYGVECGPLRKLKPGEQDPDPSWATGYFKEVGYKPVQVVKDDPLFAGLGKEPVFFESHYWEVKQLPPEFELLASTDDCRIQAMKHKQHIIYGTQFHPEVNSVEYDQGWTLLRNFYHIAGVSKA